MNVPNHIAIILDGNGRWAKAKGMPRSYGHVKGCANLETVCDYMKELGVKYVTVYAFSTENWKRSKDEVDGLMKLFRSYLKKCIKLADKNKMRVRVIGEVSAFDQDIQENHRHKASQQASQQQKYCLLDQRIVRMSYKQIHRSPHDHCAQDAGCHELLHGPFPSLASYGQTARNFL